MPTAWKRSANSRRFNQLATGSTGPAYRDQRQCFSRIQPTSRERRAAREIEG